MAKFTASLVAIDQDQVVAQLTAGEAYALPRFGVSVKLMDETGVFFVELDREVIADTTVLLNGKPVIDIAQGKIGDRLQCQGESFALVVPGQAIFTGRQTVELLHGFERPVARVGRAVTLISVLILVLLLLAVLWLVNERTSSLQPGGGSLGIDETELPTELQARSAGEQQAALQSFERAKQALHATIPASDLVANLEEPAGQAGDDYSGDDDDDIVDERVLGVGESKGQPRSTLVAVQPSPVTPEVSEQAALSGETAMGGAGKNEKTAMTPPVKAKSSASSSAETRARNYVVPTDSGVLARAASGEYEALRVLAESFEQGQLSLAQLRGRSDLEAVRQAWLSGQKRAAELMLQESQPAAKRRLLLYLMTRYKKFLTAEVVELTEAYGRQLQKHFDGALVLAELDPVQSVKKLSDLARLIPLAHPLAAAIARAIDRIKP